MQTIGNMRRTGPTQLRVALAFVFFLVSSLQGTLFASASSFGQMNAMPAAHHEMVSDDVSGVHQHGQMDQETAADQSHHGGTPMSDLSCEVHCAPAGTVLVTYINIAHAVARCFAQSVPAVLVDGNYAEFIRPPRLS